MRIYKRAFMWPWKLINHDTIISFDCTFSLSVESYDVNVKVKHGLRAFWHGEKIRFILQAFVHKSIPAAKLCFCHIYFSFSCFTLIGLSVQVINSFKTLIGSWCFSLFIEVALFVMSRIMAKIILNMHVRVFSLSLGDFSSIYTYYFIIMFVF